MGDYDLSPEAEWDLLDIDIYGLENFCLTQAEQYHEGLALRFQEIASNPLQYQAIDHTRQGYRRCVYRSHSIYYRIESQRVSIMRILGRQDTAKAFHS